MSMVQGANATGVRGGEAPRRSVSILGATGSIGRSTAQVLGLQRARFTVAAVAGGRDGDGLGRVAIELGARFAAVADPAGYESLKTRLAGTGIEAAAGPQAVVEAALRPADVVIAAIAGTAGVAPTIAAIEAGRTVALANKETLVCAGGPAMRAAAASGARLLPLDSEHNAIFQALGDADWTTIETMTLTASGGPFRTWTAERIASATKAEALAHPNWAMGPKVTIDSAGLMNKGLELVEAYHLFGVAAERLKVVVHPQSVVHGLVSFADGSVTAGLALPDMRVPIAHCLSYPERIESGARKLDLAAVGSLTFEAPDLVRFPALRLAMEALAAGQGLPTVLNAANEIAVQAFVDGRITFGQIAVVVERACEAALAAGVAREPADVSEALAIDHRTRQLAAGLLD
ncbi:1-deoxy-D-xylulose-5-phosphate reductoisomerase [Lichenifustis flavocetrariae]|uniref:1-deoxy-D-xylulose 5-phosphate reductoisomerase n=1 Tax=Lichenifustis flavocetrariae TaxID=2949735 RepID=A0AA41Z097_9HYPH|nr:1-deoxy-D-xylulose-5-phosphate reductoisomerase [Lichenifustis flavocetrariae]MCW6510393.1 1-deoxy-D-xylulose-5-phosphate reductoisomerase [Lichenifustis flavocetrariae]